MTSGKFLAVYPQFADVPEDVLAVYLELAVESLDKRRFCEAWEMAVMLFTAHWCELWRAKQPDEIAAGASAGVVSSASVDGVSVSYDTGAVGSEMKGWMAYMLTPYGQEFVTLAKMYGRKGLVVP